jgi:hypothetical protein
MIVVFMYKWHRKNAVFSQDGDVCVFLHSK